MKALETNSSPRLRLLATTGPTDLYGWEVSPCFPCPLRPGDQVVTVICLQVCPFFQEGSQIQHHEQKHKLVCKAVKFSGTGQKVYLRKRETNCSTNGDAHTYTCETSWNHVPPYLRAFRCLPIALGIYSQLLITATMPWKTQRHEKFFFGFRVFV